MAAGVARKICAATGTCLLVQAAPRRQQPKRPEMWIPEARGEAGRSQSFAVGRPAPKSLDSIAFEETNATLSLATHTRLSDTSGSGNSRDPHAGRRTRSRGTRSGEHGGRKNVRGVPRRIP